VSRRVALDEKAIHQATTFFADNPDALRAVLAATDALSARPYPDDAFPFGSAGLHWLRGRANGRPRLRAPRGSPV
jgi:hypothetical protein